MKNITTVIPFYSHPSLLSECLTSIAENRSFEKIQVILVDDCGDKKCSEIATNFCKEHENVSILKNDKNLGVAHSRLKGAIAASTTWVSFVDADDLVRPNYVENLLKYSTDETVIAHVFNIYGTSEDGVEKWPRAKFSNLEQHFLTQSAWSKLWKKDYFINLKFERIKFGEDLLTLASCKNFSYKGHDEFLYEYRVNASSVTNNITKEDIEILFANFKNNQIILDKSIIFQLNRTLASLKKTFKQDPEICDLIGNFEKDFLHEKMTYNVTDTNYKNNVVEFNVNKDLVNVEKFNEMHGQDYFAFNKEIKFPATIDSNVDIIFFNFNFHNQPSNIDFLRNLYDISFNKNTIILKQNLLDEFSHSEFTELEHFIVCKLKNNQITFNWTNFNVGDVEYHAIESHEDFKLLNKIILGALPMHERIRFIYSKNNFKQLNDTIKNKTAQTLYINHIEMSKTVNKDYINYETFAKLSHKYSLYGELITDDEEILSFPHVTNLNWNKYLIKNGKTVKFNNSSAYKKIKRKIKTITQGSPKK